jgi:hypothetical protein
MMSSKTAKIFTFDAHATKGQTCDACKKYIFWVENFSCLASPAAHFTARQIAV